MLDMIKNRFESIPKVPQFDEYRWVDYFELICLSDLDLSLNKGMLIDRVRLKQNDSIDGAIEEDGELPIYIDDDDEEENVPNVEIESPAKIDEKYERKCENYFQHFKHRAATFGEFYPFEVATHELKVKNDYSSNIKCQLYIYFLCCSSLNYFKDFQKIFTSDFEEVSFLAIKQMLPESAIAHLLGKTVSGSKRSYKGNVYAKFEQLAKDLSSKLMIEKSDFPNTSSGDGGLDIIGWFSFKDGRGSIPVFAAQCKCSSQWINASQPSSILEGIVNLDHSPFNLFFIPFAYQKGTGKWHQNPQVKNKIVIDRLRICRLLEENVDIFSELKAANCIASFLTERESIV